MITADSADDADVQKVVTAGGFTRRVKGDFAPNPVMIRAIRDIRGPHSAASG